MQLELGDDMYLFTRDGENYAAECVISAHGGWEANSGTFLVPDGVTLCFYSQDGESAQDFGLSFWKTTAFERAQEIFVAGDRVKNYGLTKYQGRHNNTRETYALVDQTVNSIERHNQLVAQRIAANKLVGTGLVNAIDVATIRNRKWVNGRVRLFGTELLLEDVIKRLLRRHPYRLFHCFFCRNAM